MRLSTTRICPKCRKRVRHKNARIAHRARRENRICRNCVRPSRAAQLIAFTRAAKTRPWCRLRPFESLFNSRRKSSKRRGVSWQLSYDELVEFTTINSCHYCDGPIVWQTFHFSNLNLDRKDNDQGYVKHNLVVCCGMCNRIKGSILAYEHMLILRPSLRKLRRSLLHCALPGGRPCAE